MEYLLNIEYKMKMQQALCYLSYLVKYPSISTKLVPREVFTVLRSPWESYPMSEHAEQYKMKKYSSDKNHQ